MHQLKFLIGFGRSW